MGDDGAEEGEGGWDGAAERGQEERGVVDEGWRRGQSGHPEVEHGRVLWPRLKFGTAEKGFDEINRSQHYDDLLKECTNRQTHFKYSCPTYK